MDLGRFSRGHATGAVSVGDVSAGLSIRAVRRQPSIGGVHVGGAISTVLSMRRACYCSHWREHWQRRDRRRINLAGCQRQIAWATSCQTPNRSRGRWQHRFGDMNAGLEIDASRRSVTGGDVVTARTSREKPEERSRSAYHDGTVMIRRIRYLLGRHHLCHPITVGDVHRHAAVGFATLGRLKTGSLRRMGLCCSWGTRHNRSHHQRRGDNVYIADASMCETGGGRSAGATSIPKSSSRSPVATEVDHHRGPVSTGLFPPRREPIFRPERSTPRRSRRVPAVRHPQRPLVGARGSADVERHRHRRRAESMRACGQSYCNRNDTQALIGDGLTGTGYARRTPIRRISSGSRIPGQWQCVGGEDM